VTSSEYPLLYVFANLFVEYFAHCGVLKGCLGIGLSGVDLTYTSVLIHSDASKTNGNLLAGTVFCKNLEGMEEWGTKEQE
jgi:hypothetical protein